MDANFLTYVLGAAVGFVVAGVIMSGHRAFTGAPMGFALVKSSPILTPLQIALRLIAGPGIILRNIWISDDENVLWAVLGVSLAAVWSVFSGFLFLQSIGQF